MATSCVETESSGAAAVAQQTVGGQSAADTMPHSGVRNPRRRRTSRTTRSPQRQAPPADREADADSDLDPPSTTDITTDDEAQERRAKKVVLLADQAKSKRWASWWRRFWMSILMIGSFFLWLFLARQTGIVVLVIIVQANIYRELVGLATRENKEKQLPGFSFFYYYWFFVAMFFIYGRTLMPHFQHHNTDGRFDFVLSRHGALTWFMYIAGIVAFVMSLKKRKLYRYQFKQFAFCHMALLVVVFQSTFLAENVFNGLLWFTLPCGMVVCNDCFAYIFGFFFGKTPLIRLSPKKTWEGFIGGFLATLVWSFWFARLLQSYPFMTCPKVGFGFDLGQCDMDALPLADMYKLYPLTSWVPAQFAASVPEWANLAFSSLQVHAMVMAVFASLVAPFGGFFASGFKRAFKIKDFGDSIPGHGGFTDRMDCQIIMGLFVYIYVTHVVSIGGGEAVSDLLVKAEALPMEQQHELLQLLATHLGKVITNAQ